MASSSPKDASLRQRNNAAAKSPPSSSSSKTTTIPTPTSLLILWDDLPSWRRDNHYILTGYRSQKPSYAHAFSSLFYLHNESVNIWSHLLGALVAVASCFYCWSVVHPRHESASRADELVLGCFFGGAVCCLGMSATYHALTDHSEAVAKWGNKLDYTGIVALIVGSYVPALYYGFFCKPGLMKLYHTVICTLGVGCGVVSWMERFRTPAWRPYRAAMFISLGLSGVVPVLHGLTIYGYRGLDERMSISILIASGAMYIIGAVLYAARWPERTLPGKFDIWGSSHQIFHICVVIAAALHLYAMAEAFDYHHTITGARC